MADQVPVNRKVTDPSLSDLFTLWKKDIMLALNCHAVATIQSFDSEKQTVTATMNYKKSYLREGSDGVYRRVLVDYPVMLDMPVLILGGGPAQITFPIQAGDECVVLFNDRDIDNWYTTGAVQGLASSRLHSFSDGLVFVGLNSAPNALSDYDMTRAVLAYGSTMVGVGSSKIKLANNITTLGAQLANLTTALNAFMAALAALPPSAVLGASLSVPAAAAITAITTVATALGGLLE